MTIPVSTLLIPYALFVLLFLFYSAFNLYHLARFAVPSGRLYVLIGLFIFGGGGLLLGSFIVLSTFDWSGAVTIPYAQS